MSIIQSIISSWV